MARHPDINLTMGYYTHSLLEQRGEAVAKLPAVDIMQDAAIKTGTDNAPVSYRSAYRNDADFKAGAADSDGRSPYETDVRQLSSVVEQCFRKA